MPADLERDLGLYATVTISMGAMIGSGIFVLPGLAYEKAGPAVILAYLLAGLIALPAALSKSEMATAMPEAGGTYLYIDRAMGPLPGTIAGLGAWFSLVFKSAFAIVGLGFYLLVFFPAFSPVVLKLLGITIAVGLLLVNVIGVKQTGRLQAGIVSVVLIALVVFIADGLTYVQQAHYHPFFGKGAMGLLEATGFVFVSYAGVTKIASVAEEVENPGRNIPLGILSSVVVMILVYIFVVFVVVGVTPHDLLLDTKTPMAAAAGVFVGDAAEIGVTVVAVLALTSMSNAGILAAARYPLAMARDNLAPARIASISGRFRTPVNAIGFTGIALIVLIAFLPVNLLAKFASAFQLIVFAMINAALVAFRESELDSYEPAFVAPYYPWVQLLGIGAGLGLLPFIGLVPTAGALGMILLGIIWFRLYARGKTEREGAALDAVRRRSADVSVSSIDSRLADTDSTVMVVAEADTDVTTETDLVSLGGNLARYTGGPLHVVRFSTVPDQIPLSDATADTAADERFEAETAMLADRMEVDVKIEDVVTHAPRESLRNYVNGHDVDLVIGEWVPEHFHGEFLGADVDWFMRGLEADLAFLRERHFEADGPVTVVTAGGPFDPLQPYIADAVALSNGVEVRLLYGVEPDASGERIDAVEEYLDTLTDRTFATVETEIVPTDDPVADLTAAARGSSLVVTRTEAHHLLYDVIVGTVPETVAERLDSSVVLAHTSKTRLSSFLRYLLRRFVF